MRISIVCVFALALIFSGCSKDVEQSITPVDVFPSDFNPSEPDIPLDVSGDWTYEAKAKKHDCFCWDCHLDFDQEFFEEHFKEEMKNPELIRFQGQRTIVQEGEGLNILDHSLGVSLEGSIRIFSGRYTCGASITDDSDNRWSYDEFGDFGLGDFGYSFDFGSTLTVTLSNDDGVCRIIWSVDGRRAD
jgi:hypothetical protein